MAVWGEVPGDPRVQPHVERGPAGWVLVSLASRPDDVLVVGAGRRGTLGRLAFTKVWLAVGLAAGALATGTWLRISQARGGPAARPAPVPREERDTWRMPPLTLLKPVIWSPGIKLGMIMLRGYLVISVLLLIVKAIQLGGG